MRNTLFILFFVSASILFAQEAGPTMSFEEYNPASTLVVPENPVKRAKFPFVDIHSHQWNLTRKVEVHPSATPA